MTNPRAQSIVAANLLLYYDNKNNKDGKILLSRRLNTGYEDGNYHVVGGHVEENETPTQAVIREAEEEAGIVLLPTDLQLLHVVQRTVPTGWIDFFFTANQWQGQPINKEPNKCSELDWFALDNLPSNMVPYVRSAIEHVQRNSIYSEFNEKNNVIAL